MTVPSELADRLASAGQSHVIQFWDELTLDEQGNLSQQLSQVDFAQIQSLASSSETAAHWGDLAARASSPPAITLDDFKNAVEYEKAYQAGVDAIRDGKVAMILTAGGQGSRLGFEHPKGMFPIGPVSERTLYQVIIEKVHARAKQFNTSIPFFVMTSPPTHQESAEFLSSHQNFGYPEEDFHLFCQGVMPAVDQHGKLILADKSNLFLSPDGHGGMLAAFQKNGCLDLLKSRGIEHVFYGQVDNPLIQACDPALVGYHILAKSEMTTQVVRKNSPLQKVGNVVSIDGKLQIIEYSDLPEEYAKQVNEEGELKFWAGSIAVHIFRTSFLDRTSAQADALPFHRANKVVPYLNEAGELIRPEQPNAIKFERFIFDLLPWAENAIVCEVAAEDGFCAVKNAAPAASETPEHVKAAILDLHHRWLNAAGCNVPKPVFEISPFLAVDQRQLQEKLDAGTSLSLNEQQPIYLETKRET